MKRLYFTEQAESEIERAVEYHERQVPGLGTRLRVEIEATCQLILRHPEQWPKYLKTAYRFRRTKVFSYVIIYQDDEQRILVVAVRHGRQRPIRRKR